MRTDFPQLESEVSLRKYFFEALLPKTIYGYIFLFLVVLKASSYWVISIWQHPNEPLSFIAMYRVEDSIEYYPLIAAISQGNMHEYVLLENLGEGVQAFPVVSILPYAIALRFFGVPGLIIADIFIALCHYVILFVFLRILRIEKFLSACTSLLVVSEGANSLFYLFTKLYKALPTGFLLIFWFNAIVLFSLLTLRYLRKNLPRYCLPLQVVSTGILQLLSVGMVVFSLWYWRIPRPFVTDVFFFLCLCWIFTLLNYSQFYLGKPQFWLLWFCLGISFAALLQGELYFSGITMLSIFALMLYLLAQSFARKQNDWKQYVKGFSLFFLTTTVGSLPFLVQRMLAHPDVSRRFGIFPVARMRIFFLPGWKPLFIVGAACLIGGCNIALLRQFTPLQEQKYYQKNIIFLCVLCFAAWIALPVTGMILGKVIQPAHFPYRLESIFSLTILVFLLYTLSHHIESVLNKRFGASKKYLEPRLILLLLLILLSVRSSIRYAHSFSQKTTRPLGNGEADASSWNTYRADFLGVIHELSRRKEEGAKVLGTFDFQVYCWWIAFQKGYSFLPQTVFTPLPDSKIEQRVAVFCKLLGMNAAEFTACLNQNYVQYFWLATLKYQASAAYTFAPIADYDPEIQRQIKASSILDNYNIVIPNSEQHRLVKQFEALGLFPKDLKLDMIVLTNGTFLQHFAPPQGLFDLVYENPTFRVWVRKNSVRK